MQITVKNQIGNTTYDIIVEGSDTKEVLYNAINFATFPRYCHACAKPTTIRLEARKAADKKGKEYTYIKAVCNTCGAKSTLGSYQDPTKGHFWKRFERFEKPEVGGEGAPDNGGEDTPF